MEASGVRPFRNASTATVAQIDDWGRDAFLFGSLMVMLALLFGNAVRLKQVSWMPESLIAIGCGSALGYTLWATSFGGHSFSLDGDLQAMCFSLFLKLVALPVITFEAGWSLRIRDFVSQLGYILLFAIVGTLISVVVITAMMLGTSVHHGIDDMRTSIAFASLMSSVDPVACLATFGHLNVDPLLFILVFGESTINDAPAIILFNVFNNEDVVDPGMMVLQMANLLFGSIGFGLALGVLYIWILRFSKMSKSSAQEIIFLFVSPSLTFQLAEAIQMSGIIAVLFCSIIMGAYAGPHLTIEGTMLASFLFKQMSSLCELLIFVFVGISVVFVSGDDLSFSLWAMLYVLVGRAAVIAMIGSFTNLVKYIVGQKLPAEKRHMLSWKHLFMMWHGGLCRGGVSLVLAMEFGTWVDARNGVGTKSLLRNATFILICTFMAIFGGTTSLTMRWLDLPMGDQVSKDQTLYEQADKDGVGWRLMQWLQNNLMIPLLIGPEIPPSHTEASVNVTGVLEDAANAEKNLARANRPSSESTNEHLFDLFGTDDPTHSEQLVAMHAGLFQSTAEKKQQDQKPEAVRVSV